MKKPVVRFSNVSKTYSMFRKKSDQLQEIFSIKNNNKKFTALSNVSFEVYKGETIGIVGINGSGKSTLSSLLAQVTPPTSGEIWINGETSLVAISAGLNNQLTGMENIELKCLMHGLTKEEIKKITTDIVEFADIGEFINQPIKSYSSGMRSRLGFAISVHVQPDILIIDEALSVGDSTFYKKCIDKFNEFKEQGKTIFFISHSLPQVKSISDRILWLNFGSVELFDDKEVVANQYYKFIKWFNNLDKLQKKEYRKKKLDDQINKIDTKIENRTNRTNRKKRKGKRWKRFLTLIQLTMVLLIFLYSGILLFISDPVEAIYNNSKIESTKTLDNKTLDDIQGFEEEKNIVDKSGLVNDELVTVFKDEQMKNVLVKLPFSSEVIIVEEINKSIYKIKTSNGNGYVKKDSVSIMNDDIVPLKITVQDFLEAFPSNFANAYSFYFSFLNKNINEIKANFKGLSSEYQNEYNQNVLVYDKVDVLYLFNEENTSKALIVKNINMDSLESLFIKAHLVSKDEKLFYIPTESYQIIIDVEKKTITFSL